MNRDLGRLTAIEHDLLVIGGGISGLIAAYDAAQRGLSVALIDRGDFGSATSFNHLKTIHGGLRYLQQADLRRMRRSVLERRTFAHIAPHLVIPLGFLAPTTWNLKRSRLAFRLAFGLDAFIGRDRNADLPARLHLPPGRVLSIDECRRLAPTCDLTKATGGALWYDYQMPASDRLTLAFAQAAHDHGAALGNYVEALAPIRRGDAIRGFTAREATARETFEIRARLTVNAAGPWAGAVMESCGMTHEGKFLKAINLVARRPARGPAIVRSTRSGQARVLAPWQGQMIVGTGESHGPCEPDHRGVATGEVEAFLAEINEAFPTLNLTPEEITLVHRGIVPAVMRNGKPRLQSHFEIIDHRRDKIQGLITAIGVKYTTARLLAEGTVNLALAILGRHAVPCRTASVRLPGAPLEAPEALAATLHAEHDNWLDKSAADHLAVAYGTGSRQLLRLAVQNETLRQPLAADLPFIRAELIHAVRHEMAQTLTDVVVRRTAIGAGGYPGNPVVDVCAAVLAEELRWSDERVRAEIAGLKTFYEPVSIR